MRDALRTFPFVSCLVVVAIAAAVVTANNDEEPSQSSFYATAVRETTAGMKDWPKDTKTYQRLLAFSGFQWSAKAHDVPLGPGPNLFSSREEDLWVDHEGLHLTISKRDGNWYCTEVVLQESLGYGSYIFHTKTEPDDLDPSVVAGMFTWEAGLPLPNRELDFEFARWSKPGDRNNAQFVIQPYSTPGNLLRYRVEPDKKDPYLTQVLTWQPGRVQFKTARGRFESQRIPESAVIAAWTRTGDGVQAPKNENIRINLWLHDGKPPATDKPINLIVSKFLYLPPGE